MLLQTTDYKTFHLVHEVTDAPDIIFTDYRFANRCLPGDTINWDGLTCELVRRAPHRFIPGVLQLTSKTIYGHSSRGTKLYLFHPHDRKYPPFRVGCSMRDPHQNYLALVDFADWEPTETMPRGSLVRMLGPCGDLKAETEALTYQYGSPAVAKQPFALGEPVETGRVPLDGFTFNIDPEGCLDIDDVLTLKQVSDTEWQFVITISDVAAYIAEGSPGDVHASYLGQTLYAKGKAVVPMLPATFSEGTLSLKELQTHLGVSLFCRWDSSSKTLEIEGFKETSFLNNKSYTYESIYKADQGLLQTLQDIASHLKGTETTDSHEWVAEAMILYNKEVAKKLLASRVGLLRTHKAADAERLLQLTSIHPDLVALAYEAAKYEPSALDKIHATLGSVPYCHASSPIRRYADLINQRNLKAVLKNHPLPAVDPAVALSLNRFQKQAKRYERLLFLVEQVVQAPSGCVEGIVVSPTKLYIPLWKHTIKVDASGFLTGQQVQVDYYADLQKPSWETRMVFRLSTKATATEAHDELTHLNNDHNTEGDESF